MITGAARGIGRAIAGAFRRSGDAVCVTDVDAGALGETAAALGAAAYPLDVADFASVHRCVAQIERDAGPIDVLINNAGVMSRFPIEDMPESEWDRVMAVNLKGVFNCCHAVVGSMRKRRRGHIINIGSIWAGHAWPNRAAYAASKAAVEQFTRCFALEVAPDGVLVNAISPGIMATDMTKSVVGDQKFRDTFMSRVSLGVVGDPADHLAGVALFLASPAAGYMSGEVVTVHGGYY